MWLKNHICLYKILSFIISLTIVKSSEYFLIKYMKMGSLFNLMLYTQYQQEFLV